MNHDADSLLAAAAVQDPDAFRELYIRNERSLLAYFQRRVSCPYTSADLAADTWIEAWRTLERYDPERGPARAWLWGIAGNQLRRWATAAARARRAGTPSWARNDDSYDSYDMVDDRVDFAAVAPTIVAALSELSYPLQAALVLRFVHEADYRTISQRLGCSEGAARVRVSRGLHQLEEHVNRLATHTA